MDGSSSITCRRCGQPYHAPPRMAWASCPACGKAARPLARHLRHNALAAMTALLAAVLLSAAIVVPLISITQLGDERAYSLLAGIRALYQRDHLFLALLLLCFSVIFPYAKLAAILAATSRLLPIGPRGRRRLHTLAVATGKYSLLDVLVVAVLIVVVKFDAVAEARARVGTYLFCAAIALSMAAGFFVDLPEES